MKKTTVRACRYGELVFGTLEKDDFPEHVHLRPCIGVVLSGSGVLRLRGKTLPLAAGSRYLLPPLVPHGMKTESHLTYRAFIPWTSNEAGNTSWRDRLRREYGRLCGITEPEAPEGLDGYDLTYRALESGVRKKGLSPSLLSHSFREKWGISFRSWKNSLRLSLVRDLLRRDDISLSDIALEAGFYDQSQMCRQFSRHMGLSPSRYRAFLREIATAVRDEE